MSIKDLLYGEKFQDRAKQKNIPRRKWKSQKLMLAYMLEYPYPLELNEPIHFPDLTLVQPRFESPDILHWLYIHLDDLVDDPDIQKYYSCSPERIEEEILMSMVNDAYVGLVMGFDCYFEYTIIGRKIERKIGRKIERQRNIIDIEGSVVLLFGTHQDIGRREDLRTYFTVDEAKLMLHYARWDSFPPPNRFDMKV